MPDENQVGKDNPYSWERTARREMAGRLKVDHKPKTTEYLIYFPPTPRLTVTLDGRSREFSLEEIGEIGMQKVKGLASQEGYFYSQEKPQLVSQERLFDVRSDPPKFVGYRYTVTPQERRSGSIDLRRERIY